MSFTILKSASEADSLVFMRSQSKTLGVLVLWLAAIGGSACSRAGKEAPPREVVEKLLRQEAESLKKEGEEDVDPSLGVTIAWQIDSIEVRERPDDEAQPWEGTVRFTITSKQKEYDGSIDTQTFEKALEYVWDAGTEKWIMT